MDEQKMIPKHSEVGVEYVRDMVENGFLTKKILSASESAGFDKLEESGTLPEGVYPTTTETGQRQYCRVESAVPDMTDEEIDRLIALRRSKDIHIIRNWIIFFGVIAVIGLAAGVISMFIQ